MDGDDPIIGHCYTREEGGHSELAVEQFVGDVLRKDLRQSVSDATVRKVAAKIYKYMRLK